MLAEPTLWHYLGSFVFYTALVIGLLYLVYGHLKRNPHHRALLLARQGGFSKGLLSSLGLPNGPKNLSPAEEPSTALWVEAELSLGENQVKHGGMNHHVYVVGVGNERFLLGTGYEGIRCLARLEEPVAGAKSPTNGDVHPTQFQEHLPRRREATPSAPALSDKRLTEVLQSLLTKPRPNHTTEEPQAFL